MGRKRKLTNVELSLREMGVGVLEAAVEALDKGADLVVADAKARVPVRSGALKASIQKKQIKAGVIRIHAPAKNTSGKPYSQYVEYDPKIDEPFLHPALQANYAKVVEMVKSAVNKAVKKNAKS